MKILSVSECERKRLREKTFAISNAIYRPIDRPTMCFFDTEQQMLSAIVRRIDRSKHQPLHWTFWKHWNSCIRSKSFIEWMYASFNLLFLCIWFTLPYPAYRSFVQHFHKYTEHRHTVHLSNGEKSIASSFCIRFPILDFSFRPFSFQKRIFLTLHRDFFFNFFFFGFVLIHEHVSASLNEIINQNFFVIRDFKEQTTFYCISLLLLYSYSPPFELWMATAKTTKTLITASKNRKHKYGKSVSVNVRRILKLFIKRNSSPLYSVSPFGLILQ